MPASLLFILPTADWHLNNYRARVANFSILYLSVLLAAKPLAATSLHQLAPLEFKALHFGCQFATANLLLTLAQLELS